MNKENIIKAILVATVGLSLWNANTIRRIEAEKNEDAEWQRDKIMKIATATYENRERQNEIQDRIIENEEELEEVARRIAWEIKLLQDKDNKKE